MNRTQKVVHPFAVLSCLLAWISVASPAAGQTDRVNLNTASQQQLEQLPGVGPTTAKKIISGRPYNSIDDLSKAGVSQSEITKLTPLVSVSATAAGKPAPVAKPDAAAKPAAKTDLNTATQTELETLPGVGPATAKKIIAGRPYKTLDDLSKSGVSKAEIDKLTSQVTVGALKPSATVDASAKTAAPATSSLDLNSASQSDLEKLPGVGPATAKKIIAARPYKSVEDLSKSGISKAEIAKLTPLVNVEEPAPTAVPQQAAAKQPAVNPAPVSGAAKIDLNSATQTELQTLPGVGPATAKKIIAARPIKSVDDLAKAGVSRTEITKIAPLVTIPPGAEAKGDEPAEATAARVPPQPGMVWVNTESKIFHRPGDRWYGKTKEGQFMTEQDAVKQGYRESKEAAKSSDGSATQGK